MLHGFEGKETSKTLSYWHDKETSFTYSKYFEPKISEVFHPTSKSKFLEAIRVG